MTAKTVNFTIPASTLRAALHFAAKNDVRFYLNGVYLDLRKGRIVSTTGHGMFCGLMPRVDFPSVIVPREVIETALKVLGRKHEKRFLMGVELRCDGGFSEIGNALSPISVTLEVPGTRTCTNCIDAKFPEYERVIPRNPSGELAHYNPDLLVTARDALNAYDLTEANYAIAHNGTSGALIAGKNSLCVVMPMRMTDFDASEIAWLDAVPAGAAEEAA